MPQEPQGFTWDDHDKQNAPAAQPQGFTWSDEQAKPPASTTPRVQAQSTPQPDAVDRTLNIANTAYQGAKPIDPALSWDYAKNLGNRVGSGFGRLAMIAPNLVNSVRHAATDPYNPTEQTIADTQSDPLKGRVAVAAKRLVYDPQKAEYDKAKTSAEQGHVSESMGHSAAAAIPFIGPFAAGEGERAGSGDIAGAVTDVGAALALPKIAKEAAPGGRLPGAAPKGAPAFPTTANAGSAVIRGIGKAAPVAIPTAIEAGAGHVLGGGVGSVVGAGLGLGTGLSRVGDAIASHPVVRGMAEFGLSPTEILKDSLKDVGDKSVSPETKAAIESGKMDIGDLVKDERLSRLTGKNIYRNPEGAEPTFTRIGNRMQTQMTEPRVKAGVSEGVDELRGKGADKGSVPWNQVPDSVRTSIERQQVIRGVRGNPADRVPAPAPKISTLSGTQQDLPLTMGEQIGSGAPNIAAPAGTSVSPNMGEWQTPGFEELSSNLKRVGRAGESKAALANTAVSEAEGNLKSQHGGSVDSSVKDTNTSLGQFAKANGPRIDTAVGTDAQGQTLANHLHSITNKELGNVAKDLKVDIGGKQVGRSGISRSEVFNKMLDAGHTPEDIVNTHYQRVGNPPSVSGGAPDIGDPNLQRVRQRLADPQVRAENHIGNMRMADRFVTGERLPSRIGELNNLADKVKTASPEELQELDRMGQNQYGELKSNIAKVYQENPAPKPNIAETMAAKPNVAEAPEGVKVWRDAAGEQHPVKLKYEYGQPVEADGRHRVVEAYKNGYDRIEMIVDRGKGTGSQKMTVPIQTAMKEFGVTPDSLAATDAQQTKIRAGGGKPRISVTKQQ